MSIDYTPRLYNLPDSNMNKEGLPSVKVYIFGMHIRISGGRKNGR